MKGRSRRDEEIDYNGALNAILDDDNEKFAKIMSHASTPDLFFNLAHKDLPKIIAGFPPLLSLAAFFGAEKCVDVLIDMKPNFNRQDKFGRLPIHFAAAGGNIDIIRKIAPKPEHIQKIDQYNDTPLSYAVMFGQLEATKYIIEFFDEYDKQYLLDIASKFGHLEVVKYIVETLGANVDEGALSAACSEGQVDVARYLIQAGADVNKPDKDEVTPIIDAINSGSLPMVCFLIRKGANFTESNAKFTPIVECAACGYLDIFDFMVQKGADINSFNAFGKRPLQAALERKNPRLIDYILDHDGIAPDMTNIIETAIKVGDPQSLRHVLDVIGDPHEELSKPSVISTALNSGEFDLIHEIIDNGAEISTQDIIFYNLLKRAIKNGAVDIVQLFIDKGLELKKCKGTMKYVFELIGERKTEEPSPELVQIMNILLSSGADLCDGASKTEIFFKLLKLDSTETFEAVRNNCPGFDLQKLINLNRMQIREHFFTRDEVTYCHTFILNSKTLIQNMSRKEHFYTQLFNTADQSNLLKPY